MEQDHRPGPSFHGVKDLAKSLHTDIYLYLGGEIDTFFLKFRLCVRGVLGFEDLVNGQNTTVLSFMYNAEQERHNSIDRK